MATGSWVNIGGTWRKVRAIYVNINGNWRKVKGVYLNIGGGWRKSWRPYNYVYLASAYTDTVKKLNLSDASQVWSRSYNASRIAVDPSGYIYVAAHDSVTNRGIAHKLTPDGNLIWAAKSAVGTNAVDIAVDASGNVITCSAYLAYHITKFNANGELVTTITTHTNDVNAVAVDSSGNIFSASNDHTIRKFNSSGSLVWTHNLGEYNGINVATGKNGDVFFTSQNFLRKLTNNGGYVWQHDGPSGADGLDVDANDYSYLGFTNGELRKINPSGSQVWSIIIHDSDSPEYVVVDPVGGVYALMIFDSLRKYNENGNLVWTYTGRHTDVAVDPGKVGAFPNAW